MVLTTKDPLMRCGKPGLKYCTHGGLLHPYQENRRHMKVSILGALPTPVLGLKQAEESRDGMPDDQWE